MALEMRRLRGKGNQVKVEEETTDQAEGVDGNAAGRDGADADAVQLTMPPLPSPRSPAVQVVETRVDGAVTSPQVPVAIVVDDVDREQPDVFLDGNDAAPKDSPV